MVLRILATVAACLQLGCPSGEPPGNQPDPLIPRSTFFSTSSYDAPQLSPDGEWIAFVGPYEGVANLYIAPAEDPAAARPLTRKQERGIQPRDVSGNVMIRWSLDSRYLLYPQDQEGDENWNLFAVDVESGVERDLTRLQSGRVELLGLSASDPSRVLVEISASLLDPPDIYALDLDSGERQLIEKNPGFAAYIPDHELRLRGALAFNQNGGMDFLASAGDGNWEHAFSIGFDDLPALSATGYQKIARFDRENRRLFFYDSRGRNTIALVAYDFETGEIELIAEDARVDIGGVLYHPSEHTVEAFATNWTRKKWNAVEPAIGPDLEFLRASTDGDFDVVSRSSDDNRWLVRFVVAHEPESYHLYQRDPRSLTQVLVTTPELEGLRLSKMHPVVIESRDGLDLVSYLSYPPWLDEDDDGRPSEPVPLVLLVHGGPSDERAQYAYGPFVHWLANRGYGVFYVNYRGSPGFGKEFVNAQRMEWGGKMHDDLIDQVEWAIANGVTTRDRVAILGGSYGGYATLVGMTTTPDVFACGVDLVGPSNLEIFMPHWNVDTMSRIVGDPRTEQGRAFLRSRSPYHLAHQAKNPILIGQGANDSRVPQSQSDSMVEVFEKNEVDVTYLLYPDEGHGFQRPENNDSFWAVAEVFLGQCLGGRSQALGDELVGSSVQVLAGQEHITGLEEALARRDASASER